WGARPALRRRRRGFSGAPGGPPQLTSLRAFANRRCTARGTRPLGQSGRPLSSTQQIEATPDSGANWHPASAAQVSVVHASPSSQTSGVPGVHTPPEQVSSPLQTVPSGHGVPSGGGVPATQPPPARPPVSTPLHP